ncbi:MAG: endo-1,4-beta-xylanase [Spirochaetales bacterium]
MLESENAGKWGLVEWERDQMTWDELDVAYEFAREHGIPFRFHTLVWGRTQPAWLGRLTDEELRVEVEEWITLAGERYPAADFIDVVNEPLHVEPPYVWALGGPGETGFDWVITSFELARQHFPDAKLGVNDFDILKDEFAVRAYLKLITLLKERGLIDTIGVQAHGIEDVPAETIRGNLDRLAEAGLPIYVTELDLAIEDDARQAERMRELVTLFWEHPAVHGVTL